MPSYVRPGDKVILKADFLKPADVMRALRGAPLYVYAVSKDGHTQTLTLTPTPPPPAGGPTPPEEPAEPAPERQITALGVEVSETVRTGDGLA